MDLKIIFILIVVLLVIYWISQTQKEHFSFTTIQRGQAGYDACKRDAGDYEKIFFDISDKSDPVIIDNFKKKCTDLVGGTVSYFNYQHSCNYPKSTMEAGGATCRKTDSTDFINLINEPNQLCGPRYSGNSNSYKSNLSAECAAGNGSWVNSSKGKKKCKNYYEKIYTNLGTNNTDRNKTQRPKEEWNKASCRAIGMSRA